MSIDKKFIDLFINVSSKAALASSYLVGKKDKIAADKAAVDAMRSQLNKIDMNGQIVIGEGELDEAPMLYIGEKLGSKKGPDFDIAVDPLEGTNFAANNLPGALSVIAVAEKSNLFNAPETYMNKISANLSESNVVDLDYTIKKNIYNLAEFKNKKPSDLTACILDRPRHKDIINELRELKVNLKLITDGDVSGALLVTDKKYDVDIFLGIGGGPEGVLAASALDSFNCFFQGKFLFETENDKIRAKKMGIQNLEKKYQLHEIVSGDSIFCATGITSGEMLEGIKIEKNEFISETLVTHKSTGLKKIIQKRQKF
jgi:fructose-1,6-bisphosphatase II / sedoheptulose-1,7-bisphosphatase|tara:strand:+ start:873 stop:1814 length:942 start_codon:yes stop_codon:yes gene_type:complete